MKMVLLLLLISCSALAQTQLKISEFPRTNTVNLTDDVIVNSTNANAATGYSTRRTSVSNLLGLVTSAIIDTNSFVRTNGIVTPQQYGALGGVNDDTVAFSNALNSGLAVYVPSWTNYTCNNLFLSNNAKIFGYGAKINFKTAATGYLIDTGTATNFYIGGLRMSGGLWDTNVSYWPTSQGTRSAIHTYVFTGGSTIENNTVEDFTDAGFRFGMTSTSPLQIGPVSTSQSYRQLATQFHGNRARACYIGYDGYGYDGNNVQEYMTILSSPANNCYYGARIACGNIYLANCLLTGNHIGIQVVNGGPNNAHGSMVGGSLNHNEISIHCQNITTGFLFNGVYIAGGGNYIWLEGSTGVVIQNGTIDCDYGLISGGGGTNIIRNNVFSTSWPPITNAVGTPTPIIYGNFQNLGTGTDPASVRSTFSIYGAYGQPTNFPGQVWTNGMSAGGFINASVYFNGGIVTTGAVAAVDIWPQSGTGNMRIYSPNGVDLRFRDQQNGFEMFQFIDSAGALSFDSGGHTTGVDLGTLAIPWKTLYLSNSLFAASTTSTNGYWTSSNTPASWPTTPRRAADAFWGNSNGTIYLLQSIASATWASTNKIGQ